MLTFEPFADNSLDSQSCIKKYSLQTDCKLSHYIWDVEAQHIFACKDWPFYTQSWHPHMLPINLHILQSSKTIILEYFINLFLFYVSSFFECVISIKV